MLVNIRGHETDVNPRWRNHITGRLAKLDRLEAAASIKDLSALPGNFFEALKGDRRG